MTGQWRVPAHGGGRPGETAGGGGEEGTGGGRELEEWVYIVKRKKHKPSMRTPHAGANIPVAKLASECVPLWPICLPYKKYKASVTLYMFRRAVKSSLGCKVTSMSPNHTYHAPACSPARWHLCLVRSLAKADHEDNRDSLSSTKAAAR